MFLVSWSRVAAPKACLEKTSAYWQASRCCRYTAESALAARRLSRVILSTEDPEIADVGRRCGLEVPFVRPRELSADTTPGFLVVKHALEWMEDHAESFDALCLLQPTNPLRRPEDIDGCFELLEASGADAVVSILAVPAEYNPHWVSFRDAEGHLRLSTGEDAPLPRRQELPPAFHREGSVYVTRRDVIMHDDSLYGSKLVGYLMDPARSINIDTMSDWERAEALLAGVTGNRATLLEGRR